MKSSAITKTENKSQVANSPSFKKESEVTDAIDERFYNLYQGAGHTFSRININGSHSLIIQPKLAIDQPSDKYEQEADAMADKVMQPLTPKSLRNPAPVNTLNYNKNEYKIVQRKSISSISSQKDGVLSAVNGVLQLSGESLKKETLAVMEPRFGYDFSKVKIHTDSKAAQSAQTVNAKAYTVGQNIVFGSSEYNPHSREGQHLLAHELTHVIQQQRGGGSPAPLPNTALEAEASSVADNFSFTNGLISVSGASGYGLSRQPLSLTKSLLPERLSDEDLRQEIHLLEEWLGQQTTSTPETDMASQSLEQLKKENVKRNKAQSATILKNPPVPVVQGASDKERLINAMSVLQSIQQVGSGLFTVTIDGQTKNLTQQDVDDAYKKAKEAISLGLSQTRMIAKNAQLNYGTQSDVDKKHYIVAPILRGIGGYKDPGPILLAKAGSALNLAAGAENALAVNNFSQAASLLADSEQAAIQADGMYKMYWSNIIATGEVTITALEYTQKVSFIALGILATIASAGAAAGLTSIAGLELGAGAATAANVVATAAPIIAEAGGLGMRLQYGDKIEWKEVGQVALNAAYSIILAKYGGRGGEGLTRLVSKTMAQNPTAKSLGRHVVTGIVHSVIMGRGGAAIKSGIDFVYAKAMGTDITWGQFIQNAWDHLFELDIEGLLLDIINGAIMGVGHGIGARKATLLSTPSNFTKVAGSSHEANEPIPPAVKQTEATSQIDNIHEETSVKIPVSDSNTTVVEKPRIIESAAESSNSINLESPLAQQHTNENIEISGERPRLTVIEGGGQTTAARRGHLTDASSKSTVSPRPPTPAVQPKPAIIEQEYPQAAGQDFRSSPLEKSNLSIVASKKQEKSNNNSTPSQSQNGTPQVPNISDSSNIEKVKPTTGRKNRTGIVEEHQNAAEVPTGNQHMELSSQDILTRLNRINNESLTAYEQRLKSLMNDPAMASHYSEIVDLIYQTKQRIYLQEGIHEATEEGSRVMDTSTFILHGKKKSGKDLLSASKQTLEAWREKLSGAHDSEAQRFREAINNRIKQLEHAEKRDTVRKETSRQKGPNWISELVNKIMTGGTGQVIWVNDYQDALKIVVQIENKLRTQIEIVQVKDKKNPKNIKKIPGSRFRVGYQEEGGKMSVPLSIHGPEHHSGTGEAPDNWHLNVHGNETKEHAAFEAHIYFEVPDNFKPEI